MPIASSSELCSSVDVFVFAVGEGVVFVVGRASGRGSVIGIGSGSGSGFGIGMGVGIGIRTE